MFLFAFVGFVIGSLLINIFTTTYDSMLACFLVEKDIWDHSGRPLSNCPSEMREIMEKLAMEQGKGYKPLN